MLTPIHYRSTRGESPELSFEDAVLAGLAPDGGLYIPDRLPFYAPHQIAGLQGLSYPELALRLLNPFTTGMMQEEELLELLSDSYRSFRHRAIAPLVQIGNQEWVLELFHGPTLAFKDFALQFLGRLLSHILKKRSEKVIVLGATSGDTGSAAIHGFRGREQMEIVILFPAGRVSDVQRRQMTCVPDANVHCLEVEGTFDDCQRLVKEVFSDAGFRARHHLVAVNSINWARILAQTVYYFYAALHLGAPARSLSFSVPTGNFGDIYAAYLARRMGLPIETLLIASNRNDILTRTLETGEYRSAEVHRTLSPSMDIQVSSNFERLLFDLYHGDAEATRLHMQSLAQSGNYRLSTHAHRELRRSFSAVRIDDAQTRATIHEVHASTGQLLDPHTAIGVAAARCMPRHLSQPMVTLATAHPAKFPDAVEEASGIRPALPESLSALMTQPERKRSLPADLTALLSYLREL